MAQSAKTTTAKNTTRTAKAPAKKRTAKAPANAGIMSQAEFFINMLTKAGCPSTPVPAAIADEVQKGCEAAGIKFTRTDKGNEIVRFERTGRKGRSTGRAPQSKTVAKFATACDAATQVKVKGGHAILLTQDDLLNAGLAKCWTTTSHGWQRNYTCGASAIACGYPVFKANVRKGQHWVVLATEGVELVDAIKACGKAEAPVKATKKGKAANAA